MNAGGEEAAREADAAAAARTFAALDQLATMVAIVHADGRCVFVNAAFESVLGLSRRSVLRARLFEWFADSRAIAGTLAAVARNEFSTGRFDALLRRPAHAEPVPVSPWISTEGASASTSCRSASSRRPICARRASIGAESPMILSSPLASASRCW